MTQSLLLQGKNSGWLVDDVSGGALVARAGNTIETVAPSQTEQVLGSTGAIGDVIERMILIVSFATLTRVDFLDGATSYQLTIGALPVGTYAFELGVRSVSGAWSVTTQGGVTVQAIGRFT